MSRPTFRLIVLATACGICCASSTAGAEPRRTARLEYQREAGALACVEESALRGAVAVRLGYDPFTPDRGPLVRARVRRDGGLLRATIELRDDRGNVQGARELSSARLDCVELSSVVALTIALAIDPLPPPGEAPKPAVDDAVPQREEPKPEAPVTSHRAESPPEPAASEPSRGSERDKWRFEGAAGIGASFGGAAPSVAPTILVAAKARKDPASLAIEGRAQLPASTGADGHAADVEASLFAAALVPCGHYLRIAFCAVGLVGTLQGASTAARARRDRTPFAAVGGRVAYEQPLWPALSIALWAELDATLTPTTFDFQDGPVWHSAPVASMLGSALEVRLP